MTKLRFPPGDVIGQVGGRAWDRDVPPTQFTRATDEVEVPDQAVVFCDESCADLSFVSDIAESLTDLHATGGRYPTSQLRLLIRAPLLTAVSLGGLALTDEALDHISPCQRVRRLTLIGGSWTMAGLAKLAHFPLRNLVLDVTQGGLTLMDTDVEWIVSTWPNLGALFIRGGDITDAVWGHFARLDKVDLLWVMDNGLTGRGVSALASCSSLLSLSVQRSRFCDDAVDELGALEQLEEVRLAHTALTSAVTGKLAFLPLNLMVGGTGVDEEELDRLRILRIQT